jgi:preprotein translocase subunit SecA
MFLDLVGRINSEAIEKLFMVQLAKEHILKQQEPSHSQQFVLSRGEGAEQPKGQTVKREGKKTGRNDPCPCGSGKKYKKCCGR